MALVFDIQPLEKVLLTTKKTVKCKGNKEKKMPIFKLIFFFEQKGKGHSSSSKIFSSARLELITSRQLLYTSWRCVLEVRVEPARANCY